MTPARWAEAPWELRDAPLPDHKAEIRSWFRGLQGPPVYALRLTRKDDLTVEAKVFSNGGQGTIQASPTSTGSGALKEVAARDEAVLTLLDPSASVIFVASAVDLDSQSGHSETIAELTFAAPDGHWVFTIDGRSPEDLRLVAETLA
jgi:hypothetical protein